MSVFKKAVVLWCFVWLIQKQTGNRNMYFQKVPRHPVQKSIQKETGQADQHGFAHSE